MKEIPQISDAEWDIMKVIWKKSPITANDIIMKLEVTHDWKPKTVKTLINRLMNKGVIGFNKNKRTYEYYPNYTEDECILAESENFLKRVYNGKMNDMVCALINSKSLKSKEIKDLKKILEETGK